MKDTSNPTPGAEDGEGKKYPYVLLSLPGEDNSYNKPPLRVVMRGEDKPVVEVQRGQDSMGNPLWDVEKQLAMDKPGFSAASRLLKLLCKVVEDGLNSNAESLEALAGLMESASWMLERPERFKAPEVVDTLARAASIARTRAYNQKSMAFNGGHRGEVAAALNVLAQVKPYSLDAEGVANLEKRKGTPEGLHGWAMAWRAGLVSDAQLLEAYPLERARQLHPGVELNTPEDVFMAEVERYHPENQGPMGGYPDNPVRIIAGGPPPSDAQWVPENMKVDSARAPQLSTEAQLGMTLAYFNRELASVNEVIATATNEQNKLGEDMQAIFKATEKSLRPPSFKPSFGELPPAQYWATGSQRTGESAEYVEESVVLPAEDSTDKDS